MGLRGPGAQRLRQARAQARPPRESAFTITAGMLAAFRKGDREFFVRRFHLHAWQWDPTDAILDDEAERKGLVGYSGYGLFLKMRKLRHALLRKLGYPAPWPPGHTLDEHGELVPGEPDEEDDDDAE